MKSIFLLTLLMLATCSAPFNANLNSRWLNGIPCRPPCWEGVTPGETTATQAVEIWKQSSIIGSVEMDSFNNVGYVVWKWIDGSKGGDALFKIGSLPVIKKIRPYGLPRVRFKDVIQAYGEPTYIVATAFPCYDCDVIEYSLVLVYGPQGIRLAMGSNNEKPTPSPDTSFEADFVIPEQTIPIETPQLATQWEGFKGWDYYCRDEDPSRPACKP